VICREEGSTNADLYYTLTDFVTDPAGVPVAPPTIAESSVNSTSFRLDINGYTDAQLQNIRYFQIDVSTDPGFSTFITASYNATTVNINKVGATMQNVLMHSRWIILNELNGGSTNYYIRIRAVNNAGASSYTTKTVATI
jgi:hypothetical protein